MDHRRDNQNWEPAADYEEVGGKQNPEALQTLGDILFGGQDLNSRTFSDQYTDPNKEGPRQLTQQFSRHNLRDPADKTSDEEEDAEGNAKTFKRVFVRFAERTSMQGVPYIYVSRVWYARCAWILLFVGGFGAMVFHLYYLSSLFFEYNTSTTVSLGFSTLNFPAVTICNVNAVRESKLYLGSNPLRELVEEVKPSNIARGMEEKRTPKIGGIRQGEQSSNQGPTSPPSDPSSGRKKRSISEETKPHSRVRRYIDGFSINETNNRYKDDDEVETVGPNNQEVFSGNKSEIRAIEDEFKYLYSIMPRETRQEMGHLIDDLLMECTFRGIICETTQFQQLQTAEYGNCYTVDDARFISTLGGPNDGLTLTIYLEDYEYIEGITSSMGLQIHIHAPGAWPNPFEEGLSVSAGMETNIGLKQVNIEREGSPYGSCVSGDAFYNNYKIIYTQRTCQQFCLQSNVMQRCTCFDPEKEEVYKKLTDELWEPCRTDDDISCLLTVTGEFRDGILNCDCSSPCDETIYEKSLSSKLWPTESYTQILMEYLCSAFDNDTQCDQFKEKSRSDLAMSFLKVNVYFEDLNYENITEQPDYAAFQFASDIGGTIGLWIGLSLISFFEVFQFFFELLHFVCYVRPKLRRKEQKKQKLRQQRLSARHAIRFTHQMGAANSMKTADSKFAPSVSGSPRDSSNIHSSTSSAVNDEKKLLHPNHHIQQPSSDTSRQWPFSHADWLPNGVSNLLMSPTGQANVSPRPGFIGFNNFGFDGGLSAYPKDMDDDSSSSLSDVKMPNPFTEDHVYETNPEDRRNNKC